MNFLRPRIITVLLLLTSATAGLAVHALSAAPAGTGALGTDVSSKPAYLIYIRAKTDNLGGYESYSAKVPGTYEGRTYRALVLNGVMTTLEGSLPDGVVVVQFPSVQAAKAQYYSAEYQAIAGERQRAAQGTMFIVEGLPDGTRAADVSSTPAYLIGVREKINNLGGYESYSAKVPSTYEGRNYRALVLSGAMTRLEGSLPDGVVVVQFPSIEAAKAQYYSAEYQAIAGERQRAAQGSMFIVDGVPASTD